MSKKSGKTPLSRRDFIHGATAAGAAGALFGGFGMNPFMAAAMAQEMGRSEKPLKAAFSNAGLQATWCAQGKQAAEYWGKLFNVDVTWFDGELSATKQRSAIDNMASQQWDFVAIQAFGIGTLTAPVNRMIDAGIPVIDMDTLIAPLDQINVHSFLAPDNEFMGAAVTQALVNELGGKGKIVMTQGALGHTGAQGRARGFQSVVEKFPDIEVLDESPADWDVTKAVRIWDSLLTKHPEIDAAFFHNDDMALAAANVMQRRNRNNILIGGGGDDVLTAYEGNDQLFGKNGKDTLNGGGGNDLLKGGNDNDVLIGGLGADLLYGESGYDTIYAGEVGCAGDGFVDVVDGGNGQDVGIGVLSDPDTLIKLERPDC